jgi:hypothetical protein
VALFTLQFAQRPPDDLIEIIGRILDANVNSAKRREDRILITPDSFRRLNLFSKENAVFIQGVPRRCILRDISFSGAKIIMVGVAKFLLNREAGLRMDFDDPRESFQIRGKFIRSEAVEGRKDLIALAILFDEVPMGYKLRINDFLGQTRASERNGEEPVSKTQAAPKPATPTAVSPPPEAAPAAAAASKPAAPADKPAPAVKSEAPTAETPASEDFNLDIK